MRLELALKVIIAEKGWPLRYNIRFLNTLKSTSAFKVETLQTDPPTNNRTNLIYVGYNKTDAWLRILIN